MDPVHAEVNLVIAMRAHIDEHGYDFEYIGDLYNVAYQSPDPIQEVLDGQR